MRSKTINPLVCVLLSIAASFLPLNSKVSEITEGENYAGIGRRMVEAAIKGEEGYQRLKKLCSIGPRMGGSDDMNEAIQYVKREMARMDLDRIRLRPVRVSRWERGGPAEVLLSENESGPGRRISAAALGGSVGTGEKGVRGKVVEVRSFEEMTAKAAGISGKIVFFNCPMKKGQADAEEAYREVSKFRKNGAVEASRLGAVAVAVRSLTTRCDDRPHTGIVRYREDAGKIPAVAVSCAAADELSDSLRRNPGTIMTMRLSCRRLPAAVSHNVMGEITGAEFPMAVITVAGHLDSWDLGSGAHDDGGGCMQALEVLSLIKRLGLRPKRTIRCVLFEDEENDSRGAVSYAEEAVLSGEAHLAAIESDLGVFAPRGFSVDGGGNVVERLQKWLPVLKSAGIEWVRSGRSGMPDVIYMDRALVRIGSVPDQQRYFDLHHSANDNIEAVDPGEMELGSAGLAILAYLISEEGL